MQGDVYISADDEKRTLSLESSIELSRDAWDELAPVDDGNAELLFLKQLYVRLRIRGLGRSDFKRHIRETEFANTELIHGGQDGNSSRT